MSFTRHHCVLRRTLQSTSALLNHRDRNNSYFVANGACRIWYNEYTNTVYWNLYPLRRNRSFERDFRCTIFTQERKLRSMFTSLFPGMIMHWSLIIADPYKTKFKTHQMDCRAQNKTAGSVVVSNMIRYLGTTKFNLFFPEELVLVGVSLNGGVFARWLIMFHISNFKR